MNILQTALPSTFAGIAEPKQERTRKEVVAEMVRLTGDIHLAKDRVVWLENSLAALKQELATFD